MAMNTDSTSCGARVSALAFESDTSTPNAFTPVIRGQISPSAAGAAMRPAMIRLVVAVSSGHSSEIAPYAAPSSTTTRYPASPAWSAWRAYGEIRGGLIGRDHATVRWAWTAERVLRLSGLSGHRPLNAERTLPAVAARTSRVAGHRESPTTACSRVFERAAAARRGVNDPRRSCFEAWLSDKPSR